jgi:beta-lactam-binding protein with PASTA domain
MPSARPQGDVIEQRPPAPATLACDATIELIVSDGSLVIVPNVTQMPVASARTRIADADLVVDAFDQDSDATPGDVLTQQPVAGSEVPRRTSVRLAVAMGLVVPAVTGLSLIEAMQQLKPFRVSPARVDSEEPEDEVTWQQPLAGTRAAAGSEVTLRVSQGPFLPTWALWAVLAGALLLGTAAVAKALPHLIKASVRVDTDAESAVSTDASTEGPPIRIDAHLERGVSRARFPGATA